MPSQPIPLVFFGRCEIRRPCVNWFMWGRAQSEVKLQRSWLNRQLRQPRGTREKALASVAATSGAIANPS